MGKDTPLVSSRRLANAEGDPVAVVRVRNLQTTIQGPKDAWGRGSKQQPLLISAEVSLTHAFPSSSSDDKVASDTVHYGLLSKSILSTLDTLPRSALSLSDVLNRLWVDLTGFQYTGVKEPSAQNTKAFLDTGLIRRLSVSLVLPKASLMGTAIRLSGSCLFADSAVTSRSLELGLEGIRVPTLIGVNSNERNAKQVVITNIRIDEYQTAHDDYAVIESIIVDGWWTNMLIVTKAMSESSFETLEALAASLAFHIARELRTKRDDFYGQIIRIGLEKPTAVPLAEAACVELTVKTEDVKIEVSKTKDVRFDDTRNQIAHSNDRKS
ncbi:unnamed protein product [Fusarium fujikuroi]|nr:unnamed protein product [Fusarium fujikuroi]VZH86799.1 unnamed protein product [Fusarium fujikuroi]